MFEGPVKTKLRLITAVAILITSTAPQMNEGVSVALLLIGVVILVAGDMSFRKDRWKYPRLLLLQLWLTTWVIYSPSQGWKLPALLSLPVLLILLWIVREEPARSSLTPQPRD